MLFERQRLLLTLLDAVGEPVGHTDFQKLLFLYTQECEAAPSYEFVPYKFGAFSEDALVEQPAVELLAGLGWQTVSAFHEVFGGADPSPLRPSPSGRGDGGEGATHEGAVSLGRESAGEVVLLRHLVPALKKLNPKAPAEAIDAAVNELTRDHSVMSLAAANREVYALLKNGVKVEVRSPEGELVPKRIRVIDWDNPANNHFLLVSQLWVTGDMYQRRPDLVGFINGLPLVVSEFKAVTERVEAAFKDNIRG